MNDKINIDDSNIRLLAVGDVMLGDHPVCFGHGVRSTVERFGFQYIFEDVIKTQLNTDLLFGNLEAMFSQDTQSSGLYDLEMKGKAEYASKLAEVGFNVMSVSNNHALQHGLDVFENTVSVLKEAGIHPVGICLNNRSNDYKFEKNGVKIAVVSYSMRPEKYYKGDIPYAIGHESDILDHICDLKANHSHVVVSVHWGEEYVHYPSVDQVRFARKMVDSGASLIIGHHPHVLQGVEHYNGGYIAYSLGNYVFDHWQKETRETLILDCEFGKDRIERFELIPILIDKSFQPKRLHGKEAERLRETLETYSKAIPSLAEVVNGDEAMEEYMNGASKAYKKYRIESYMYFLRNIYKYKFSVLVDSMMRFLKRRINPDHP